MLHKKLLQTWTKAGNPSVFAFQHHHVQLWYSNWMRANLVQKHSWQRNRSCNWLILSEVCDLDLSSCLFGGSVAWHPKNSYGGDYQSRGKHKSCFNKQTHVDIFLLILMYNFLTSPKLGSLDLWPPAFFTLSSILEMTKKYISFLKEKSLTHITRIFFLVSIALSEKEYFYPLCMGSRAVIWLHPSSNLSVHIFAPWWGVKILHLGTPYLAQEHKIVPQLRDQNSDCLFHSLCFPFECSVTPTGNS